MTDKEKAITQAGVTAAEKGNPLNWESYQEEMGSLPYPEEWRFFRFAYTEHLERLRKNNK